MPYTARTEYAEEALRKLEQYKFPEWDRDKSASDNLMATLEQTLETVKMLQRTVIRLDLDLALAHKEAEQEGKENREVNERVSSAIDYLDPDHE